MPVYGQSETFTAQVQALGTAPTPSGTVQFIVDGMDVGLPVQTSSANTAIFNDATLAVGQHSITAEFFEGGTVFDSSGSVVIPVIPAATTITTQASIPSATYGQTETLTAEVVSNFPSQANPAGTVQFLVDGTAIGSPVSLSGTQASVTTTAIPAGNHEISASFTPVSSNFSASDDKSTPVAVTTAPATLTISANPLSLTYGTPVPTLLASYNGFVNGDTTASLIAPARLSTTANPLSPVGSYPITVLGAADPNYVISYVPSTLTISTAPTTTNMADSVSNPVFGQFEIFTATISAASPSSAVTSGKVQFYIDGSAAGSPVAYFSGQASFSTTSLGVGTHQVAAAFLPNNANLKASDDKSSPLSTVFTPSSTSVGVTSTSPTSLLGQSVTFTAVVNPASPSVGVPTGKVTFQDVSGGSTTNLGSANLTVVKGVDQATFTTTSRLALGSHTIVASYGGDANNRASTSAGLTVLTRKDPTEIDLDGDAKADLSVFGPIGTTGKYGFQTLTSSTNFNPTQAVVFDNIGYGYGNKTSIPVSADYFGEGKAAYALWTPNASGGMTFTAVSSVVPGETITANFGGVNDVPVIADVDGDGKADFGVYGYQKGLGYRFDFLLSSDNFAVGQQDIYNNNGYGYGNASSLPVVADFDGSGKAGFGLYNPSTTGSTFTYVSASGNFSFTRTVGNATDIPMAVNYDGDGLADLALYGPDATTGKYRVEILTSTSNYTPSQVVTYNNNGYGYGNQYSTPVLADYEGTGKADIGVYTTDFDGGMVFDYQTSQTGAGVGVLFGVTGDIALTGPSYLRAEQVRALS